MRPRLALGLLLLAAGVATAASADGKEVYLANKCERCHGVARADIASTATSDRMRGPDLSDIGSKRDAEWMVRYLRKEIEVEDKAHRTEWKGSKKDLERLAAWLASLNGEPEQP